MIKMLHDSSCATIDLDTEGPAIAVSLCKPDHNGVSVWMKGQRRDLQSLSSLTLTLTLTDEGPEKRAAITVKLQTCSDWHSQISSSYAYYTGGVWLITSRVMLCLLCSGDVVGQHTGAQHGITSRVSGRPRDVFSLRVKLTRALRLPCVP